MGGAAAKVARRGIIPAAAYGSRTCGVSDAELRQIRALVGKTITPNTKGTSLALKLMLDGDPATEANAAPVVRWAEVAWDAAAQVRTTNEAGGSSRVAGALAAQHSEEAHAAGVSGTQRCEIGTHNTARRFRVPQLNAAIAHAQRNTANGSWETVSGPASAVVLTIRRINWQFKDGTTIMDERGKVVDMARTAPSCVRSAVERATRGASAAAAAQRWQRPEFRNGIWTRPVRTALGKLPPPAKAALRRSWMGGYWSRARLADNGLAGDAECDKCGCERDDAYHRIWECSWDQIQEKRKLATSDEMRAEAARVDRDDWTYTRGLIPNPWMTAQPPRADYDEIHVDGNMRELSEPLTVDVPAFIDGSALWPSDPDARRAGWSIVVINDQGDMVGAIYGHLPWAESDAQTAGHAEMYALRRAAELAVGDLHVYTDYKEAAEGISKGEAATTAPTVKHAAQWRAFWRAVDGTRPVVEKVKGHSTEAEVAHDAALQWKRKGNALADRMAKKGAKEHYTADQWGDAKATAARQERHVELCAWIGTALGEWPTEKQVRRKMADRQAMQRRRQERRDAARLVGGHRVSWGRDGWKCQDCGKEARTPGGATRMMNQHCRGHITTRIPEQTSGDPSAHVLWTAEADDAQRQGGANVTWCSVCGAYSSTKLYKLGGPCGGPAQSAALTRLRALQELRHPVHGYRLKTPHRMTNLVMQFMVKQAAERRQRYADTMRSLPEGGGGGASGRLGGAESSVPHAATDRKDVMEQQESEEDVFGHGAAFSDNDNDGGTTNAASWLVSDGHSASGRSRTVSLGLVAASRTDATAGSSPTKARRVVTAPPSDIDHVMGGTDADADGESKESEEDVFGYGGGLSEQCDFEGGDSGKATNAASWLVSEGHSASGRPRTVPLGLIAASRAEPAGTMDGILGRTDANVDDNPASQLVHTRRSAGSGARAWQFAANYRGTHVWEWRESYGTAGWSPASARCEGNPCFCDLQLTLEDIRAIRRERGLNTADEIREAGAELVAERHAKRNAERRAMSAEDGGRYCDAGEGIRSAKWRRRTANRGPYAGEDCIRAQLEVRECSHDEGTYSAEVDGTKRRRTGAKASDGAARCPERSGRTSAVTVESAGPTSSAQPPTRRRISWKRPEDATTSAGGRSCPMTDAAPARDSTPGGGGLRYGHGTTDSARDEIVGHITGKQTPTSTRSRGVAARESGAAAAMGWRRDVRPRTDAAPGQRERDARAGGERRDASVWQGRDGARGAEAFPPHTDDVAATDDPGGCPTSCTSRRLQTGIEDGGSASVFGQRHLCAPVEHGRGEHTTGARHSSPFVQMRSVQRPEAPARPSNSGGPVFDARGGTKRKAGDSDAKEDGERFRTRAELLRALLGRSERGIDRMTAGTIHGERARRRVDP